MFNGWFVLDGWFCCFELWRLECVLGLVLVVRFDSVVGI